MIYKYRRYLYGNTIVYYFPHFTFDGGGEGPCIQDQVSARSSSGNFADHRSSASHTCGLIIYNFRQTLLFIYEIIMRIHIASNEERPVVAWSVQGQGYQIFNHEISYSKYYVEGYKFCKIFQKDGHGHFNIIYTTYCRCLCVGLYYKLFKFELKSRFKLKYVENLNTF